MSIAESRRCGAVLLALLMLCACATPPKNQPPPPPAAAPALDASYDWHGLLGLPFGTVLRDCPFPLHEVLMFRDAAHAAQSDDAECYAIEQSAPRFLSRTPSEYLLCFKRDHLARVEATVQLPGEEAPRIFSDACTLWQKNASAAQTGAVQTGAVQTGAGLLGAGPPLQASAGAAGASACDGRDGAIAFSGVLEDDVDGTDSAVTIRLDAPAGP